MLRTRLIVIIIMVPIISLFIAIGGWFYAVGLTVVLGLAAWEFWHMFTQGGYSPSAAVMVGGTVAICLARAGFGFLHSDEILAVAILLAMAIHTIEYERGKDQSALDFCISLGGLLYCGWLGAYLISLRNLPNGEWWMFLLIPAVSFADGGAYAVGKWIGKHKFSPRVSPKKTWEGYLGGILFAIVLTPILGSIWHSKAPSITTWVGMAAGAAVSLITPLGDLGESMLKRQFGFKDTSNLLPGHGGVLDRIDTWLWVGVIGYYLITWLKV